jgi:hypothetical protein
VFGAKHHFVNTAFADFACFAKLCASTRQQLQLNGDVLHDVAHPCAAHQTGEEAAAVADAAVVLDQPRQPSVEPVVESVNFVGRVVFHLAQIDQRLDDGAVGPDVGSTQVIHAQNLNVFECHVLM